MLIDTIEEQYPDRLLAGLDLSHTGFTTYFELDEDRRMQLRINAYWHNKRLSVFETLTVKERGGRMPVHEGKEHIFEHVDDTIPTLLKGYLQTAIGDIDKHTYENSFAGLILEQLFGNA